MTIANKRQHGEPALHAAAIKSRGDWIPGVGDAAGLVMTQHDSEQLVSLYRRLGLNIELPDKAVETGIQEVWEAISAGRFKVFASCEPWFQEYRLYHRNEQGRIVKTNDHLMDATRYAVRSGRSRMKTPVPSRRPVTPPRRGTPSELDWMAN